MSDWYLYVAQAPRGWYYVGITTEPTRRIAEHNTGRGSRMARGQGPFRLVYVSPRLPSRSAAQKLEVQVKRWRRDKKEQLIAKEIELEA